MQGQPVDRRPVCLTLSLYGARLIECPLDRYYTDPVAYADGLTAAREEFQPDFLTGPFALVIEGEAFGSMTALRNRQAPILRRPAISTGEQIEQLTLPDVDGHPRLLYVRRAIQTLAARYRQQVPLAGILSGPLELCALIMGTEEWLRVLLENEEQRRRVLELTGTFFVRWANAMLSDGASFLIVPAAFASSDFVPRRIAAEVVRPTLENVLGQVGGPVILHHASNRLLPFLDLLADLPNLAGFVLDPRDDFAEARRIVGPEKLLLGGIDGPTLIRLSREEVRRTCLAALENRRDDPRFVLATTAADVDYATPPETIHAVREAAEEFAQGTVHVL